MNFKAEAEAYFDFFYRLRPQRERRSAKGFPALGRCGQPPAALFRCRKNAAMSVAEAKQEIMRVISQSELLRATKSQLQPANDRNLPPGVPLRRRAQEDAMDAGGRETGTLIGSDKVEGTAVFGPDDARVGSIERLMIDKRTGKVSYAVLSFGGFLGVGDDHYPLPWDSLRYDTALGGYRTGITVKHLAGAPKYSDVNSWDWDDDTRLQGVSAHYGVVPT